MTAAARRVVVFGATSGLGQALARRYAQEGFEVAGLGRQDCDLSDRTARRRFLAEAEAIRMPTQVCVVAAGVSEAGYADELPSEAVERCFEVNFFAPLEILERLLRPDAGCRSFVFVLSGVADLLVPGLAAYGLSKRALRDYLLAGALEGSWRGGRILRVWPGPLDTAFDEKTKIHGGYRLPRAARRRSPDEAARRIFAAERAGRTKLVLSPLARWIGRLRDAAPCFTQPFLRLHPAFRGRRC